MHGPVITCRHVSLEFVLNEVVAGAAFELCNLNEQVLGVLVLSDNRFHVIILTAVMSIVPSLTKPA
jgi:hypothetical protein